MAPALPDTSRKAPRRQWHRAFGIALMDVFAGAPWTVELELELALKSQLLDVAIIEATGPHAPLQPAPELPDGLENLRAHNLLTYKSHHEALTPWVLDELIGYYVNYRKLKVTAQGTRHPPGAFGLYAVTTRAPERLAQRHPLSATAWEGVYDLPWGAHVVRVIVLNRIATHPRNAAWELFASERDRMRQGLAHFRARHPDPSRHGHWELLEHLYLLYRREAPTMAYTMEQFIRETHEMAIDEAIRSDPEAILKRFDPEQRLRGLDPEQRLRGLDPEQRLRGLDPEQRLQGLDPEQRLRGLDPEQRLRGLDPEQRLQGLDPATIEAWLAKQRRDF